MLQTDKSVGRNISGTPRLGNANVENKFGDMHLWDLRGHGRQHTFVRKLSEEVITHIATVSPFALNAIAEWARDILQITSRDSSDERDN